MITSVPRLIEHSAILARILAASPRFDRDGYVSQAALEPEVDAAVHYVTEGWEAGLEPLAGIETAYLRPYLAASGLISPPAVAWLEYELKGAAPPRSEVEANLLAQSVRASSLFDEDYYGRYVPEGIDRALHYVVIGESLGLRPSSDFDPAYYADAYVDLSVIKSSARLLLHFDRHGRAEQRRAVSVADRMTFEPLPPDDRPVVLVICHEATRTGAPILGWNLIRHLSEKYRVVSVLLRGGELEGEFRKAAAASTTPLEWSDLHAVDMRRVAERLVREYRPAYAIANSIETEVLFPELAQRGVPVVALIHEFAANVRPREKLYRAFDWAHEVVFPAEMVANSSIEIVAGLPARGGIHVLPQGRSVVPCVLDATTSSSGISASSASSPSLRLPGQEDFLVILGAGRVQLRKGVEVFVETAAAARRMRPDLKLRFVWVGHGFAPETDLDYSNYLQEQICRSDLGDSFSMFEAVEDIESVYRQADIFLLSSRLDPQPNVAIDTMSLGIPTICFEGGVGTAEILARDPVTADLVVPHLDAHAAAQVICRLADQPNLRETLGREVARIARATFDMADYAEKIDQIGLKAAASIKRDDLRLLSASGVIDPSLLFPPHGQRLVPSEWAHAAALSWRLWNGIEAVERGDKVVGSLRRAHAGFHPTVYACAHREVCLEQGRDPLAHWIEAGQPAGPWSHPVYRPSQPCVSPQGRIALHGHFRSPELIGDFLERLMRSETPVDLFLTADTETKVAELSAALTNYRAPWEVCVFPDRGRDMGPFLTWLSDVLARGTYEVIGHVHASRGLAVNAELGERGQRFLWENLLGGRYAMVDAMAQAFTGDASLGLLFAEDPHIVGWNGSRELAKDLARRMDIAADLPDFLDYPVGNMFWARAAALQPLLKLSLSWDDPSEPLPGDGILLHALERLMPMVVGSGGYSVGGLRVPGTSW